MDRGSEHCTEVSDQNHSREKEMQEGKVVVLKRLRNTLSTVGHYQIFFIIVLPQFMIVYIFLDDIQ